MSQADSTECRRSYGREASGGVLELHEDPPTGVVREFLEKIGIKVNIRQLTGVY
ncbi:hypothetical protein AB0C98_11735 [Streptomyces sp. NPDC048558]|uniref:NUDIX hydrolase n=1 Tax=Streptomyces sp. NPDC048558 TaxID=3155759 RepID=UPI0033F7BFF9